MITSIFWTGVWSFIVQLPAKVSTHKMSIHWAGIYRVERDLDMEVEGMWSKGQLVELGTQKVNLAVLNKGGMEGNCPVRVQVEVNKGEVESM